MKLLLHTCCAPCSIKCVEALSTEGMLPVLFWYNPNIHPYTEYRSRRDSLYDFAKGKALELILEDEYGLRSFINSVERQMPLNTFRCGFCYKLRMEKAARYARENGFDAFSTTLLISSYQDHELIKKTGEDLARDIGIEFLYRDFRPLFREGRNEAKAAGYYMQKYCGCIYSEEERYLGNGSGSRT